MADNTEIAESGLSGNCKRVTPLSRLIELRSKGLSIREVGAITGDTEDAIFQRFSRAGILSTELLDYRDNKAAMHEALQYRIHNAVSDGDIEKAPLGTKVLAICQLEDKIRLIRGQSTANTVNVHLTILDAAEQAEARDRQAQDIDTITVAQQ